MSEVSVTIRVAAAQLGVTQQTIRNWLKEDAPRESEGEVGRGRGARVVVADLLAWRARRAGIEGNDKRVLECVAEALLDVFRCDGGEGMPLHRSILVRDAQAAAILYRAFEHIHRKLTGQDPEILPPEMQSLFGICVESARTWQR